MPRVPKRLRNCKCTASMSERRSLKAFWLSVQIIVYSGSVRSWLLMTLIQQTVNATCLSHPVDVAQWRVDRHVHYPVTMMTACVLNWWVRLTNCALGPKSATVNDGFIFRETMFALIAYSVKTVHIVAVCCWLFLLYHLSMHSTQLC